jgi:16S rRNA (cytidine1402-2'-O)-methyltransferase
MSEQLLHGALYIVSTPIGNLEDMTYRAVSILSAVDLIVAEDTRTTKILLEKYHITTPTISYYSYNEQKRTPQLIEKLRAGKSIALVTDAGTPGISDPAFAIITEAVSHGIPVIPVPGASALLAALVAGGLPMDRFVFEGFLPQKKGRKKHIEALRDEDRTVVIYESPYRILKLLQELQDILGERNIVVARELTKKFEEVVRGSTSDVLKSLSTKEPRGEYVVLLGAAVELVTKQRLPLHDVE